jgi:hypothetical protein
VCPGSDATFGNRILWLRLADGSSSGAKISFATCGRNGDDNARLELTRGFPFEVMDALLPEAIGVPEQGRGRFTLPERLVVFGEQFAKKYLARTCVYGNAEDEQYLCTLKSLLRKKQCEVEGLGSDTLSCEVIQPDPVLFEENEYLQTQAEATTRFMLSPTIVVYGMSFAADFSLHSCSV